MNVKMQLKADEAREGMRVTYGVDAAARREGTLTGETRVTHGVTRFKVRPIDGGRAVWVVYVWAADVSELVERVEPVRTTANGGRMVTVHTTGAVGAQNAALVAAIDALGTTDVPALYHRSSRDGRLTFVFSDQPAPALYDPRVVPVSETFSTTATMFDQSLTLYADGTRVVVRGVSQLATDMWDGRTGVTVGRLPAFPYSFQAVRWDDSGEVHNVVPHILHKLPAADAPLAPGDRVEVGGRERIVTSVVPGHRRGRRSLYVAHVSSGAAPHESDVTTIPLPLGSEPRNFSPRSLAAHALTSAGNTLRPAGIIVPETPPTAGEAYVAARERGEGVSLALTRARLEMVADAVLMPRWEDWQVDARELSRVTRSLELDALSGTVRDASGKRLLFPLDVPDGIRLTVRAERDDDSEPEGECYGPQDVKAWREGEWEFRTVVVTARAADGAELTSTTLGGVEVGAYWPGTEAAQVWPHVPDLARTVLASLPGDALPGHPGDALPTVSTTWSDDDRCPVVRIDVAPGAGHVQVQLGDVLIYDADPELSPADALAAAQRGETIPESAYPLDYDGAEEGAFHVVMPWHDFSESPGDAIVRIDAERAALADQLDRLHRLAITALGRGGDVSPADVIAITEP